MAFSKTPHRFAAAHGLHGVFDQVIEHLPQEAGIAPDRMQARPLRRRSTGKVSRRPLDVSVRSMTSRIEMS